MSAISQRPRVALIHALAESIEPAHAAFAELWPEAWCYDLFDSALAVDRAEPGSSDDAMVERCARLADYAAAAQGHCGETQAILFTCSAFGPAIRAAAARHRIPIFTPNDAAFRCALAKGSDIGLVVTYPPSRDALERELDALAATLGRPLRVTAMLAEGALTARRAGDLARHHALIVEAAARLGRRDAILLGQFSMAGARSTVEACITSPVITTPHAAVSALKEAWMASATART